MEKEKLSNELNGLVGENSFSERTWNNYLDKMVIPYLPSNEAEIPDYLANHAAFLRSLNGQFNHDVAGIVDEFKKNYKPEPPVTIEPPKSDVGNPNDEIFKRLQEVEDFKRKMEDRHASEERAAKRNSLIADAQKKASEQGATDETVLSFILPLINPTESDTVDTLSATIKAKYDEAYTKLRGGGYTPASGSGSYNPKANTAAIHAFKEQMIKEGKLPSKNTN